MAGISGRGWLRGAAGDHTLTINTATDFVFDGLITQDAAASLAIAKSGPGRLKLTHPASDFTGGVFVKCGTLELGADAPSAAAGHVVGVLGNSVVPVVVGDGSLSQPAALLVRGGMRMARDVQVVAGGGDRVIGASGSGTATFSGQVTSARDLLLTAPAGATVSFTGPIQLSGGAKLTVTGGGQVVLSALGGDVGDVTESGASLQVGFTAQNSAQARCIRATGLTLSAGAALTLKQGGPASKVQTLAMDSTAHLNLKDSAIVIASGSLATVRSLVISHAIFTDSTVTTVAGKHTAVGYASGAQVPNLKGVLEGQSFTASSVLLKYTYKGDANLDGSVDPDDVAIWAQKFTGAGDRGKTWAEGDWNYDGAVDPDDVALWAQNFTGALGGNGLGAVAAASPITSPAAVAMLDSTGQSVVPEPSSVSMLALAGLLTSIPRRRRSVGPAPRPKRRLAVGS